MLETKLGNKGKTFKLTDEIVATIVDEKYNKLLGRLDIRIHFDHITTGTPSRAMVREFVAKVYGVDPNLVVVKEILGEYGRGASNAHVHVYESVERMKLLEPKYILKRNGIEV